jgi:hypothetical protein
MAKARCMKWRGDEKDNVLATVNRNATIVIDAYCYRFILFYEYSMIQLRQLNTSLRW